MSPVRCSSANGFEPFGSTFSVSSTAPVAESRPTSTWTECPPVISSATTNSSPRAVSITGVPVIPTVGAMSPQGSEPAGTGWPTVFDQTTAPVVAESA